MIPIIQPGLLSENGAKPLMGLHVGQVYRALNPFKFPGELYVMYVQAASAIASAGLVLRQEWSIMTEGGNDATGGSTTTIVDSTHGIATTFIDEDNPGYFGYIDDAVVGTTSLTGTNEVREVSLVTDANTFTLQSAVNDAVTSSDDYIIWKWGRVKVCGDEDLKQPVGVSCILLTDEYYGFAVVRGPYMIAVNGGGSTGTAAITYGAGVVPGNSGLGQGEAQGTDSSVVYAIAAISVDGDTEYIPAYVSTLYG